MAYDGGDFGFVGASYSATNAEQDRQESINWFVEKSTDGKSKTPNALLGVPGLSPILTTAASATAGGEVRGCWVLPGGQRAVVVCGSSVGIMTMTVPATQTTRAQFSYAILGTIGTNSGRVVIRDNGIGGYVMLADGVANYLINLSTLALSTIADAGFVAAQRLAFIDGWLIGNRPGTNEFFTNSAVPYTTTFGSTFFARKDSSSDYLVTLFELNRELWLVGERSYELWYNAGGANFSFSRIPGINGGIGCAAVHSIASTGKSLCWLGRSERGENVVVNTEQYGYKEITNPAVAYQFSTYPLVADAIGDTYEEGGHTFYQLTFPTADKTWAYDFSTNEWHERASFTSSTGAFHRARANCMMNFQNLRMVGDYISGYMHQQTRAVYTDAGFDTSTGLATEEPLVCVRRAPILWSRENRNRLFHSSLQIDFRPGVGLQTGQGEDPQVMVRWSDDGGETFGNEHWVTIGKSGKTKNRAILRKLGQARDRQYEARFSDPVQRDIAGATLFAEGEA